MESTRWNLRECSVRLRRCDPNRRRSTVRAERGGLAEPQEYVSSIAPHDLKDCNDMHIMVKKECDSGDAVTSQGLHSRHSYLREGSVTDVSLLIKEEDDFVVKTENEMDEVTIKQELYIGPTVLQSKTTSRPFPSLNMVSPPDPRRGTSSADGVAAAAPCLVLVQSARGTRRKVEDDNYERDSRIPSDANLMLNERRADDNYQGTLQERSYGQCRYCFASHVECVCRTNAKRAKAESCAKRDERKYYKYSTMKQIRLIKDTHTTCTHWTEMPCKNKQCEYSASRLGDLKRHTRTHTGEKRYKCERCEYSASRLGNLKVHMRVHTGEKPYNCEHCEYSASRLSNLKRHACVHTGEKPYKCEQCEYSTSRLGCIKVHLRIHTGEKPYKCEQCEYSASLLGNLKVHMRVHTGKKPYKCEHCEYSTTQQTVLKKHKLTHMGVKPFKCEQCEYSATQLNNLKRHVRTHTGEKPHKCKQCKYSSSRLENLKVHMCIHTGEKPYKCEHCEYRTSQRHHLKRHIRTHTGE